MTVVESETITKRMPPKTVELFKEQHWKLVYRFGIVKVISGKSTIHTTLLQVHITTWQTLTDKSFANFHHTEQIRFPMSRICFQCSIIFFHGSNRMRLLPDNVHMSSAPFHHNDCTWNHFRNCYYSRDMAGIL